MNVASPSQGSYIHLKWERMVFIAEDDGGKLPAGAAADRGHWKQETEIRWDSSWNNNN